MRLTSFNTLIVAALLLTACTPKEKTFTVNFEGQTYEQKWAIKDLNPELPSDWESFDYLSFDLTSTTTQRFQLKLYDQAGMRRIGVHPFQGAWVRVSVPLYRFKKMNTQGTTMSATYQAGLPGCWLNFHSGPFGTLGQVDSLGIALVSPIGTQSIQIKNVELTMEPQDSIYSPIPLVDKFGQWIPAEWPGKAKTDDELQAAWAEEDASLKPGDFSYSKFGGYANTQVKATGFFRVEKVDGKWWFVDPEGHLFYSTGSTGIGPRIDVSRIQGREYIYAELPPTAELAIPGLPVQRPAAAADRPSAGQQQGSPQGARPQGAGRQPGYSFYTWNLFRRFGSDWYQKWMDFTVRRMDAWGLNTIANWSDATLGGSQRKPYVVSIGGWGNNASTMGMPDVYAPDYASTVDASAERQCAQRKDDPYLIGYFIGNEPIWPGREAELIDIIIKGEETPMKAALLKHLQAGDTKERRLEFVYNTYSKFVSLVDKAIKKYDPNHLNLGLRFGGSAHEQLINASKESFDVFSINVYGYSINSDLLQRIADISGLPIVIGEFHFGTPGRGLAPGLAQVSNQEERGVAYRYYVENCAANPAVVGTHWFQWLDQPSTGRNDGENYNIGFLDVTDRPYKEFIDAVIETNKRFYDVHSGKVPPVSRKAVVN